MIDRIDAFIEGIQIAMDETASPEDRGDMELQLLYSVASVLVSRGCPVEVIKDTVDMALTDIRNNPDALAMLESIGESKH